VGGSGVCDLKRVIVVKGRHIGTGEIEEGDKGKKIWVAVISESDLFDSAVVGSSDVVRTGGEEDWSVKRRRSRGSVAGEDITSGKATRSISDDREKRAG
jgi:hypothetical protein